MDKYEVLPYPNRIADSYADKTIFLSGGTGFMGKVLIEKLLRSCSDLKKIILMVRNKKNKNPNERIKEIVSGPLFDKLKEEKGEKILEKIQLVEGDLNLIDLGISQSDREMLIKNVEIIFHCAATIRFDVPLKEAVLLNVRGTKFMLDLAKECQKLMCFVHMSTAYCHLNEKILYEKPYPPPTDPHNIIKAAEWLDEENMELIKPKLLGDMPNTYAFTKALGEALVIEQHGKLPVIILRPSIVIPIWREPLPGWTDNINGPMGLLIAAGKGVLRTMYIKEDSYADYLPVDIAINAAIISVYDFQTMNGERWIYNLTSSGEHKVTMEQIINYGRKVVETRYPFNGVAWYPGGSMKRSRILHLICVFLFHLLPALFVDTLLTIIGYKPVLMRVQKRIWKGFEVFEYYTNNQWDFNNDSALQARSSLNPKEREIFKCDGDDVDYFEYFATCTHAARLYILKESDDTLPAAKRHMNVMWVVDKMVKIGFWFLAFYYFYKILLMPFIDIYV